MKTDATDATDAFSGVTYIQMCSHLLTGSAVLTLAVFGTCVYGYDQLPLAPITAASWLTFLSVKNKKKHY